MTKTDEYRNNADLCRKQASLASSDTEKERWLGLAASWLKMAEAPPHGPDPQPAG